VDKTEKHTEKTKEKAVTGGFLTVVQELNPVSQSAYFADNYSKEEKTSWSPNGWTHIIGGHPCYDPKKVREAAFGY
jgi:hypothetical protein